VLEERSHALLEDDDRHDQDDQHQRATHAPPREDLGERSLARRWPRVPLEIHHR